MSEVLDAYWRQPPIARTIASAVFLVSAACHAKLLSAYWLLFSPSLLLQIPPEIWRPVTAFLVCGGGLELILEPYYVFTYLKDLETANPKFPRKVDLAWYLITVGTCIVTLSSYFLHSVFFLPALSIAMCYTSSQDKRGQKAGFLFFTVPAQSLPYCMILVTMLMQPAMVPLQVCGLVSAHMHDFFSRIYPEFGGGRNFLATPVFLSRFSPSTMQRGYGTAFSNQPSNLGAKTSARPSTNNPVLPDSWRTRGAGHRLGGE